MNRAVFIVAAIGTAAHAGPANKRPAPPPVPASQPAPPPEPPTQPLPAANDPRMIIAVLDVRIDGTPPDVGTQFQKALDAQVDPKHFFVARRSQIHEIMASSTRWTDGCDVGPCLQELRNRTRASIALLASLTGSGTSFAWVITLARTDSGNVVAQRAERCDVCTVDEALRNATRAAVDLLSAVPEPLPDEHPAPARDDTQPLEAKLAAMHHARSVTGIGLLVAGVAAAAAGTAVYYAENHSNVGLGVGGIGAGLLVGSLVTFTF
ncbi:MAG TPA: hypothetical protein VGG28_29425 [Kofleriaceae bacterium]